MKRRFLIITIMLLMPLQALAISPNDKQAILNDTIFYDENEQCLAGGPAGSGPLYGLHFPKISDKADLSKRIDDYITKAKSASPLVGKGDAFVTLGEKYDVNPAFMVGDAEHESSLGTTGQAVSHNYFGIRPTNGYPDNGHGFALFPSVEVGLEEYYKQIGGPGYLAPPTSFTQISQVTNKTTPVGDGSNDPNAKATHVIDVMHKILDGMAIDATQDDTAAVNVAPLDSCGQGTTTAGALGWDISGPHAMTTYLQGDPKWGSLPYGPAGKNSMKASGCGPTSIAMVLSTLLQDPKITPLTIGDQYGAQYHTDGTAHGIFGAVDKDYAVTIKQLSDGDLDAAAATLRSGGLVVATFAAGGYFTTQGHFMVIRAVSPDGSQFYIADPANITHNTVAYSKTFLLSDGAIRKLWAFTK